MSRNPGRRLPGPLLPGPVGLAPAGVKGVQQVISDLLGEFDLTLGVTGHTAVDQLSPEILRHIG